MQMNYPTAIQSTQIANQYMINWVLYHLLYTFMLENWHSAAYERLAVYAENEWSPVLEGINSETENSVP